MLRRRNPCWQLAPFNLLESTIFDPQHLLSVIAEDEEDINNDEKITKLQNEVTMDSTDATAATTSNDVRVVFSVCVPNLM